MTQLRRLAAVFTITLKRLWAQKGLSGATAVGLTAVVALMMISPLYASGVYRQLLLDDIERVANQTNRSPFTYFLQYQGRSNALQWEEIEAGYELLASNDPTLGLPTIVSANFLATKEFRLFPESTTNFESRSGSLGRVDFVVMGELAENVQIVEGEWALPAPTDPELPIEITVSSGFADRTGVQIGERFFAYDQLDAGADGEEDTFPVIVAGIWEPLDPRSDYWYKRVSDFDDFLVIPEETFIERISPVINDEVNEASWFVVLDGTAVGPDQVNSMVNRFQTLDARVSNLLPDVRQLQSPVEALELYYTSVNFLGTLLTAFNVPIIGLVLAFIGLVVGLAVNERRNEIAVMRSRGAGLGQMLGIGLLEGVVLGVIAFGLGSLLAIWLTGLIGRTRSFLDFSAATELQVVLTNGAIRAGLTAVLLALVARIIPTLAAARHTIITYKQDRARSASNPWWQRMWLDLLLLIPAGYGFYLLRQQGGLFAETLQTIGDESEAVATVASADPFQNPLLLLVPALTIFAFTLLFLRIMPYLMRGLSWLLAQTSSVGLLLAVRQLARTPSFYATPLILLILTVSLAVFTASLARTMDLQLYDQSYYEVGADVSVFDFSTRANQRTGLGDVFFVPTSAYRDLPGVLGAARVGRYPSSTGSSRRDGDGVYLGVDRADFAQAAFWRADFAGQQLGTLLNRLAITPNGVLLPHDYLADHNLGIGDIFRQEVAIPGGIVELENQIVGVFDYFPSWYPEADGFLAVANLDDLFRQAGGDFPYHIWLRLASDVTAEDLEAQLQAESVGTRDWDTPLGQIRLEQTRPERQGLFGLLSVGFVAAALLTVFGFFLYALFSFRRRFIELGVLRAVGLGTEQMLSLLAFELGSLILLGLGLGTLLGTLVSQEFIPYLQLGGEETALVPPYLVEIAWSSVWQIYILFGLLFLVALIVLGGLLLRMKIFQAVKLGETI
ncbi:MAG: ABC transporter permease [Chloroflexota bacterium]